MLRATLAILLAVFAAFSWGQGPIETRNHRASSLAFFRFQPRGGLLTRGQSEISAGLTVANDLRKLPNSSFPSVVEDQETARLSTQFRRGEKWGEWQIEVPLLSRGGGVLDPLIESWHEHILGITNLRSEIPNGRSEVIYPGSGRFGSAAGIGDISFTASRSLGKETVLSAGLKLPTGEASKLLGSGATDFGLNLSHQLKVNRHFDIHAQLGYVWQGGATRLSGTRSGVHQESLAFVVHPNSRDAWSAQWQGEASALRTGDPGSDSPHRMLSLGYTRRLNHRESLQIFFSEDGDFLNFRVPEVVNIAPDFTIGIRWSRRF